LDQNGFFERFENSWGTSYWSIYKFDPFIISKKKLSHENAWSFTLIHFVFWWTLTDIIKNESELNSSSCGHSDTRMDQSLNYSKKVLEMTFFDGLERFQFGWLKIKGFYTVLYLNSVISQPSKIKLVLEKSIFWALSSKFSSWKSRFLRHDSYVYQKCIKLEKCDVSLKNKKRHGVTQCDILWQS